VLRQPGHKPEQLRPRFKLSHEAWIDRNILGPIDVFLKTRQNIKTVESETRLEGRIRRAETPAVVAPITVGASPATLGVEPIKVEEPAPEPVLADAPPTPRPMPAGPPGAAGVTPEAPQTSVPEPIQPPPPPPGPETDPRDPIRQAIELISNPPPPEPKVVLGTAKDGAPTIDTTQGRDLTPDELAEAERRKKAAEPVPVSKMEGDLHEMDDLLANAGTVYETEVLSPAESQEYEAINDAFHKHGNLSFAEERRFRSLARKAKKNYKALVRGEKKPKTLKDLTQDDIDRMFGRMRPPGGEN
jgi:hypothetical protein